MTRDAFFAVMPVVGLLFLFGAALVNAYLVAKDQKKKVYRHRHTHWSVLVSLTLLGLFLLGYGWLYEIQGAYVASVVSLGLSMIVPELERERDIRKRQYDWEHHEDHHL